MHPQVWAGLSTGKRSRPETPLLKWKIDQGPEERQRHGKRRNDQNAPEEERVDGGRRKGRKGKEAPLSARELAAGLWRLQSPETGSGVPGRNGQLGFQPDIGHIGVPFLRNRNSKTYASEANDLLQSPRSTSRNGFLSKVFSWWITEKVHVEGDALLVTFAIQNAGAAIHGHYGHIFDDTRRLLQDFKQWKITFGRQEPNR